MMAAQWSGWSRSRRCPAPGTSSSCAAGILRARRRALRGGTMGSRVAGEHQRGRADPTQPRPAGPARARDQLARVAPDGGWSGATGADLLSEEVLARGDGGAVENPGGEAQEGGGVVPER